MIGQMELQGRTHGAAIEVNQSGEETSAEKADYQVRLSD